MNVHIPIDQLKNKPARCPRCTGTYKAQGSIDTPPIHRQLLDKQLGVTREWKATRYFCPHCNHLFDVIEQDNVTR